MGDAASGSLGGCMCGAVRYRADGEPSRTIHCHCTDCRKHTGAPVACLAVYTEGQVSFSGADRGRYASPPGVERGFCGNCGSSLTFETDLRGYGRVCAIHISTFDDPENLPATHHSYYAERIPWFDVADDLPRYRRLVVDGELIRHGPEQD